MSATIIPFPTRPAATRTITRAFTAEEHALWAAKVALWERRHGYYCETFCGHEDFLETFEVFTDDTMSGLLAAIRPDLDGSILVCRFATPGLIGSEDREDAFGTVREALASLDPNGGKRVVLRVVH